MGRGDAAGCHVDILWRRVAATPRGAAWRSTAAADRPGPDRSRAADRPGPIVRGRGFTAGRTAGARRRRGASRPGASTAASGPSRRRRRNLAFSAVAECQVPAAASPRLAAADEPRGLSTSPAAASPADYPRRYPLPISELADAFGAPVQLYAPYFCPNSSYFANGTYAKVSSNVSREGCGDYAFDDVAPSQSRDFYDAFFDRGVAQGMVSFEPGQELRGIPLRSAFEVRLLCAKRGAHVLLNISAKFWRISSRD